MMLLQSVLVLVWKYISRDRLLIFQSVEHNEFSLDHLPFLNKRIAHSPLLMYPKTGEWNLSLSSQTLLALYTLKLLGFPRLETWTFIPPNPLLLHLKQFHPILIIDDDPNYAG